MAGGIGDFSVSAGREGAARRTDGGASAAAGTKPVSIPGSIPQGARLHYIILSGAESPQPTPLRFHNGFLDEIKGRLNLTVQVPLPEMPGFFPAGAEGEMRFQGRHVFHLDSALGEQPLLSHLETLRALVQKCAERKITFPDFVPELNRIPIPTAWRNEIVNGLFDNAKTGPVAPPPPKSKVSEDLDKIMDMFKGTETGGTALSPHLGHFLDEVGRDSTGFILRDGAAKELLSDLSRTLETLKSGLLRHGPLARTLGFLASLQRLARLAKGRDRQTVHLWSEIPADPASILSADADGSTPDLALGMVLVDPLDRTPEFLQAAARLAAGLSCPLLVQLPGEEIPVENAAIEALSGGMDAHTYFFAGGVASRVDGDACVFRPAALAFLEGLVAGRETVDFYLHRAMELADQDIVTEKGQARATDKLLDQAAVDALSKKRVNRVNGARNRTDASFPLLYPWKD